MADINTPTWDELLGIRGWWLIIYGVLPANLSLLGISKSIYDPTKAASLDNIFMILLVALPLLVTFSLIKRKLKMWYLYDDHLLIRTFIVTLAIFLFSGFICYTVASLETNTWCAPTNIIKAVSMAVASMTVSSSLFFSSLLGKANLSGLPTKQFEDLISEARNKMLELQEFDHTQRIPSDRIQEAIDIAEELVNTGNEIRRSRTLMDRTKFETFFEIISVYQKILKDIRDKGSDAAQEIEWKALCEDAQVNDHQNMLKIINLKY